MGEVREEGGAKGSEGEKRGKMLALKNAKDGIQPKQLKLYDVCPA